MINICQIDASVKQPVFLIKRNDYHMKIHKTRPFLIDSLEGVLFSCVLLIVFVGLYAVESFLLRNKNKGMMMRRGD